MTGGMGDGLVSARKVGDCMRGCGARVFTCRRTSLLAGPQEGAAPMPPATCRSPSSEIRFERCAARGSGEAARPGTGVTGEALRAPVMTRCLCCTPPARAPPRPTPRGASRSGPRPLSPHAANPSVVRSPRARRSRFELDAERGRRTRNEERGTRHEARGSGVTKSVGVCLMGPSKNGVAGCVARALAGWALVTCRSDLDSLRRAESNGIAPAMLQCVEVRKQAAWF